MTIGDNGDYIRVVLLYHYYREGGPPNLYTSRSIYNSEKVSGALGKIEEASGLQLPRLATLPKERVYSPQCTENFAEKQHPKP